MTDVHATYFQLPPVGPPIFRRLWSTGLLHAEDLDELAAQAWKRENIPLHKQIQCGSDLCFMASGFAFRSRVTAEAERHLMSLAIPGDICTYTCVTGRPAYAVPEAGARSSILRLEATKAAALFERNPRLLCAVLANLASDNVVVEELLTSVGRRPAMQRIAHLLCELEFRYRRLNLTKGNQFTLKLTQVQMGKYLALSAVHVNRVIQELRRLKLIELRGRALTIPDVEALQRMASFSSDYLEDHLNEDKYRLMVG
jgi:CRP-like cAMP-binding protein